MWQDITIKVETEGELDIAADGNFHMTWQEGGANVTVILPESEVRRIHRLVSEKLVAAVSER